MARHLRHRCRSSARQGRLMAAAPARRPARARRPRGVARRVVDRARARARRRARRPRRARAPSAGESTATTAWSCSAGRWGRATTRGRPGSPPPAPCIADAVAPRRAHARRLPGPPARGRGPRRHGRAQPVGAHHRARCRCGSRCRRQPTRCSPASTGCRRSTTTTTSSPSPRRAPRCSRRCPTADPQALRFGRHRVGRAVPPRDLARGVRRLAALGLPRRAHPRAGGAAREVTAAREALRAAWQPLAERFAALVARGRRGAACVRPSPPERRLAPTGRSIGSGGSRTPRSTQP